MSAYSQPCVNGETTEHTRWADIIQGRGVEVASLTVTLRWLGRNIGPAVDDNDRLRGKGQLRDPY